MATVITKEATAPVPEPEHPETIIIDLGRQSRKRVRKLRKGKGRLMVKIEDAISDLRTQGVVEEGAQTVVVVVREEFSVRGIFDDDDEDDDD